MDPGGGGGGVPPPPPALDPNFDIFLQYERKRFEHVSSCPWKNPVYAPDRTKDNAVAWKRKLLRNFMLYV